ncbi:hypothetical protein KDW_49090 [Dictyobacter vulcani]|uniref:Uncharacterized protein n=2 Tax=Dictyobacter vulcani TaxID=2607529 RepID=A0A5J4KW31_9CHLR|nr:hypothetical protein KDW_49090 [Dictyobacter vulcani]
MVIWSDANLQGWSICFVGTGFVNMTSFSVNPFWNWNDQASSYGTGCLDGIFYTNTNGWGQSQPFTMKTTGNFDGYAGHLPNDALSSIYITSDHSPNC